MKTLIVNILSLALLLAGSLALAQNEEIPQKAETNATNRVIPTGMEEIQLGGSAKLIVPEGAKTRKVGAQVIVEGTKEYMSRRFSEMEAKMADLEKRLVELETKIEALQKKSEEPKTTQLIK